MLLIAHQFLWVGGIVVRLAWARGRLVNAVASPATVSTVQASIKILLKSESSPMKLEP